MSKLTAEQKFYLKEYGKLVGLTVKNVVFSDTIDNDMVGLEFSDGTVAWISQDGEGNGPGALLIDK